MLDVDIEAIGVMSGTSLDGVDIACCKFVCVDGHWNWTTLTGNIYPYPSEMLERLKHSHELSGHDLAQLDVDYGCDLDRFQHECSDGGAQSIANKLGECVIYDSTDNRYYTETEYHELMIKGASMSGDVFTDEEWEQFKEDESKESVNTWYYPQK